jgi:hypothetical protein
MARIPAGWSRSLRANEATFEGFIMSGDLAVTGQQLGVMGFFAIPQTCGPVTVESRGGAVIYAFMTPNLPLPAYSAGIEVTRVWQQQWIPAEMTNVRHGLMYRSLRTPDPGFGPIHGAPGGYLRMTYMPPGFLEPRHEVHHNCWEEIIILSGDMMMKDRGLHVAGSYLSNPANVWHYPAAVQRGCLLLIQTDAPQDVEFRNYDGGYPYLVDYMEGTSLLDGLSHQAWHEPVELQYWTGETAAGIAGLVPQPAVGVADSVVVPALKRGAEAEISE